MKIYENIYLVPSFVNCYFIEREDYCILIDTGTSKKASKIIHTIKTNFPEKPLKVILVTHAHLDHTAGLKKLGQLYGSKIISHEKEKPYIMKSEKMPSRDGLIGKTLGIFSNLLSGAEYSVDQIVTDGEIICGLKVYHLPGHTPGTIALEDVETKALFCGDIIDCNKKGDTILPPKKLFALNYNQALISSVKMLQVSKPSAIFLGHGKPIIKPASAIKLYLEQYS